MFQIDKTFYLEILSKIDDFLEQPTLEEYYLNSAFQFDILDGLENNIENFFFFKCKGCYYEINRKLQEQYSYENCEYEYFSELDILEIVLSILYKSSLNEKIKNKFLSMLVEDLKNHGIIIEYTDKISIKNNKLFDSGSYSNIYYYTHDILLKKINFKYINTSFEKRLKYEFENTKKLEKCNNILKVYNFNESENSYTMQKAEMCLYDYLKNYTLQLEEKIKIIQDILAGLKYAHENSIIHRDLHLGNIFKLGNNFVIADFGLSKDFSKENSLKSSDSIKSNHLYTDPEILLSKKFTNLDEVSDIYSLGVIIQDILGRDKNKFKYFLSKCKNDNRNDRYKSISEVINDFKLNLESIEKATFKEEIEEKIKKNIVDKSVECYLTQIDEIEMLNFVRTNQIKIDGLISKFAQLTIFNIVEKFKSIIEKSQDREIFIDFNDFSIIGKTTYKLFFVISDKLLKEKCKKILEYCAEDVNRYDCMGLYKEIKEK